MVAIYVQLIPLLAKGVVNGTSFLAQEHYSSIEPLHSSFLTRQHWYSTEVVLAGTVRAVYI